MGETSASFTGSGRRPENLLLAGVLTTAAFFCVALVGALAKVSGHYASTGVILLAQNLICLVFITPVVVLRGGWSSLRTSRIGLHLVRAATGTACWYALFFAIMRIPLANATLLTYSAPLWMPLIAWIVTRQRVSTPTWVGAAIGFGGVVLVLQPQSRSFSTGELAALAGALLLAVAMMSVRWLGATEPITRVLFYYFLLSTVMSVPVAMLDWQPIPARALGWLLCLGFAQLLSQILIVLAYRYAAAEKVGPFIYSVIVFTALIDWVVWGQAPTPITYLGMVLVIGGGLVAVRAKPSARNGAADAAHDAEQQGQQGGHRV